uniref:Uncharacterized protein n=1 Tax=Periophthalmus magnuspinnatus TaxID=409849 RepID=A0A3B4B192_9GOBI
MKPSHGVIILCVLATVTLICESAHQKLNSVSSVPKHSLLLLHWFANQIDFDQYGRVTLTFNPNTDFGSHPYANYEGLLYPSPTGYQYYTVGNLNLSFPVHVRNPPAREYDGRNQVRIIFSAERRNNRIRSVFLTQHERYPSSSYDPNHTFEISTILLRDIRRFSWDTLVRLQSPASTPTSYRGNDSVCSTCLMFTCFILFLIVAIIIISLLANAK